MFLFMCKGQMRTGTGKGEHAIKCVDIFIKCASLYGLVKGFNLANGIYNLTDVFFCFSDWCGARLKCGYLKNDEVYEYLDKLNSFVPPKERCMQYHCHSILSSHPFKIHDVMRLEQTLYIVNKNPRYMKCPCGAIRPGQIMENIEQCTKQCMHNIESGKCKEAFIVENIGKVFFAGKYKDKQK
jgi:hypothetical protein